MSYTLAALLRSLHAPRVHTSCGPSMCALQLVRTICTSFQRAREARR